MIAAVDELDGAEGGAVPRSAVKRGRGKTKQDYGTPWAFIHAVEKRFGPVVCDLAAHAGNAKASVYYDAARDTLTVPWAVEHPNGLLWLNPEFGNIEPYAAKCVLESRERHGLIAMLTPASIATAWYADYVHAKAFVLGISPRLTFEGTAPNPKTGRVEPYPKDLMLSIFGYGLHGHGGVWRWTS